MKYRIKEYIRADGRSFFEIQERILFFWFTRDMWTNCYALKKDACDEIARLESLVITKTKIHDYKADN